jgi:hypothetical protein
MLNPHLLTSDKPLKVKVRKIDGNLACLGFSDGQQFEVNLKFIPKSAKVGQSLYLSLVDEDKLETERGVVAKAVLDEILG